LKGAGFNTIEVVAEDHDTVEEEIAAIIRNNSLDDDQMNLISSVIERYGSLSSMELELLTHNEAPWIEARYGLKPHESSTNVISKEFMKDYYSGMI